MNYEHASSLRKYLIQNGVRYSHSIHSPAYTAVDVGSAELMPASGLATVVVYVGDNGFGMLTLPADSVVDPLEVRRLLGLTGARLATEAELSALFPDCAIGTMPPFGNLFDMPVLLDESMASSEFMAFSAGTHRDVLHISVADFRALVNPLVASFAIAVQTRHA